MRQMKTGVIMMGADHYYEHFNLRLLQRYGMNVSKDEYMFLCSCKIHLLYVLTPNKRFGVIRFKGKNILVVKDNASGLLNTALPDDSLSPRPSYIRKMGISTEQFNDDLNEAIYKITELSDLYKRIKDDRYWFMQMPQIHKYWMLSAAKKLAAHHPHETLILIVKNLYNP